ncbi:hypothetical protein [Sporosalibacterium faouarense]|uniref:spermine/spermidine synthase domain-containing protein n=1 Tax=Sporosalibacterium faouarense TaxID=516123 RepID=UPI00192B740E|nr:hypothetical protein [Sporosalibacterium faouarense]
MARLKKDQMIYFSVFLITLSLFSYEVLLTRLFSVILSFNLVFLVVSFSILGSGLGGILVYRKLNNEHVDIRQLTLKYALFLPIAIIGTIMLIYKLPYIRIFFLYPFIGVIPFIFGGGLISIIFREFAEGSYKIYFMDLVGSALGSILIIKIMNIYGFMYSLVIITGISLFAAVLISIYFKSTKMIITKLILILGILGLIYQPTTVLNIEKGFTSYITSPNTLISYLKTTDEKPLGISYSKWNAVSRTDVIETTNQNEKTVVTDGGGSAPIIKFNGNLKSVEYLKNKTAFLPFSIGENDKSLVIGSGGGKDILLALLGGSKDITAVEINSSTIEAVNLYKEFSGDIYGRPEVKVYNKDGRNFIENTKENYDNIYLAMVMTNAIENTMYSLSETYLFTEEAFKEYFSKLTADGKLSFMPHDGLDMARVVNTGIKVLMESGVDQSEITNYFVIVNGTSKQYQNDHGHSIMMPMVIFKKNPFSDHELSQTLDIVKKQGKQTIHYPGGEYEWFKQLSDNEINYKELLSKYGANVSPISDNKPFFYNYSNLIPGEIVFLGIAMGLIWLTVRRKFFKESHIKNASTHFILIGMAFMLVEIPIVQKTSLYLGNPTLAFSSVLFSILLSSGIGSLISGKEIIKKYLVNSSVYLLVAGLSIVTVLFSLDRVFMLTSDLGLNAKFFILFLNLLPMGIFMGMPFPTGINAINKSINDKVLIPLMWGANGIFSVIGSILAISISIKFGFDTTIFIGAMLYLYLYIKNPLKILAK